MKRKKQSKRLTDQHKLSKGVEGIFGKNAKLHDASVGTVSLGVKKILSENLPDLEFRFRKKLSKKEINEALQKIDPRLGQTLFVPSAGIRPDGGIIEVKDRTGKWRIILISEAKRQGKDVENIGLGKLVGTGNDQDIMSAGNAIERSHKNISEIANLMLAETYFPYILFLEGSNFLTKTIDVTRPDGRVVTLQYDSGTLNRLDRLTASNLGLPINTNLCRNIYIKQGEHSIMIQATSMYTQGDGTKWDADEMAKIMIEVAETSLEILVDELP